jgi:hypothetical protein
MPINVVKDSLFKLGYNIKYLTGWDNLFKPDKYSGGLRFYNGSPLSIVDVKMFADTDKLTYEDITVTYGEIHNHKDIEKTVRENEVLIYEMCKSSPVMEFVLDLANKKVIEVSDFKEFLPRFGLNTFFIFENVVPGAYYCLVNSTVNIKDGEFYAWFISYVYSNIICLTPRVKPNNYAKKFLQAISLLASSGGNRNSVRISDKPAVLDCGLSDCGEYLYPIPGENTKRYEELALKSIEQFQEYENKRSKK